jgi:hypothetical protein
MIMATTGHRFGFNRRADIAGRTGAASAARRHCRLAAGALAVALEPDVRLPPSGSPRAHGVVRMSSRAARAGSEVPAPLRRHLDARKRRAVFTGDLPPTNHATYSLDLFAPWTALRSSLVGRDSHDHYGSSATSRRQQRAVRRPNPCGFGRHRRGASHAHSYAVWQRRRPAVTQGTSPRATATQPANSPTRPKTGGRDGPQRKQRPSVPTAHSRQLQSW